VKVSGAFKKKVRIALTQDMLKGTYIEKQYQIIKPVDNRQTVVNLGTQTTTASQAVFGDPVRVLDAASILWNAKTPIAAKVLLNPGNFDAEGLKIHCDSITREYILYNNSANIMQVKLIDYSPKSTVDGLTGTDFIQEWAVALALFNPPAAGTQTSILNPLNILVDELGNTPRFCPQMTQMYSMDETYITLEPGKQYIHKVTASTNKLFDYAKYYVSNIFSNYQKFCKGTVAVVYGQIVSNTDAPPSVGRFTDIAPGTSYGLLVETTDYYNLRMPEQAGFTYPNVAPVAGTTISLYKRNRAFALKNWAVTPTAAIMDIDDDNPLAPKAAGTL